MPHDTEADRQNFRLEPKNHDGPIHQFFGLTYSSYFVIPRLVLQEAPIEWQERFVALMNELEATGLVTPTYVVYRRDLKGRLVKDDPWGAYRHGTVAEAILEDKIRGISGRGST